MDAISKLKDYVQKRKDRKEHEMYSSKIEKSEFDSVELEKGQYKLEGVRKKNFARFGAKHFQDYVEYIRNNPNSSYDSYCNNLVLSGYNPQWFSALQKEASGECGGAREVVAGRILEYFGVPVVYETLVRDEETDEESILSLDFVGKGEKFYSASDIGVLIYNRRLDSAIATLDDRLDGFVTQKCQKQISQQEMERMKYNFFSDLIYSILVRVIILRNSDFHSDNFGILLNEETGKFRMAPNFDLEKCFAQPYLPINTALYDFVKMAKYDYPEVYDKFVNNLNKFTANHKTTHKPTYKGLLNCKCGNNLMYLHEGYIDNLKYGIKNAKSMIEQLEKEEQEFFK